MNRTFYAYADHLRIEGDAYRWGGAATAGMWLAALRFERHHIYIDCVVDDFGTLVPVSLALPYGMTLA